MAEKIVDYYRGQYLESTIDVNYPDIGKKTYTGYKPIIVSNQYNMNKSIEMPAKGDLITIEDKQYRVLKTDGNVAEVLCMYSPNTSVVFDTNSSYNNTYEGKNIDTYCNDTFYSTLSSAMQSAIVDKTFTQDSWYSSSSSSAIASYSGKYGSSTYIMSLMNKTYGSPITRHCYCLSVQDVIDYLEVTTSMTTSDTTLTDTNIWQMFWNQSTSISQFIWLRSARSSNSNFAFTVYGDFGILDYYNIYLTVAARPAFQIDLSKIEWTK